MSSSSSTPSSASLSEFIHLSVDGMMCQANCGSTVTNALLQVPGVIAAGASFEHSRAYAEVPSVQAEQLTKELVEAVEDVGFDARILYSTHDNSEVAELFVMMAPVQVSTSPSQDKKSLSVALPFRRSKSSNKNKITLHIQGMSCARCTARVENAVNGLAGVERVDVILPMAQAIIQVSESENIAEVQADCIRAIHAAGYSCHAADDTSKEIKPETEAWRGILIISIVLLLPMMAMMISGGNAMQMSSSVPSNMEYSMFLLSTAIQTIVGYRYYKAAWHGWSSDGVLGMDFLVVLGTTASYCYSLILLIIQWWTKAPTALEPTFGTGAMLLTFVTLGKFLEAYAKGKTTLELQKLIDLQPQEASRVVLADDARDRALDHDTKIASLEVQDLPISSIEVGDYLRVLPGAKIPADGILVAVAGAVGEHKCAYVNEAAFTGEPMPVRKDIGDSVFGSTVNQNTPILIQVVAVGDDTALSKIVQLVVDAQSRKAPIQAYADKLACLFVPTVLSLSVITFVAWIALNYKVDREQRFFVAFMSAISVIVVACPCALGLATPTAVMVGTGVGARHGLLIKGGAVLEEMHGVDTVVFDKTGTLTTGKAVLASEIQLFDEYDNDDPLLKNLPNQVKKKHVALWLASCAEVQSEHPLAQAIVNAAKSKWGGDVTCSKEGVLVDDVKIIPGSGVECRVSKEGWGSYVVRVGNSSWTRKCSSETVDQEPGYDSLGLASAVLRKQEDEASKIRQSGQIAIFVSVLSAIGGNHRRPIGVFGIDDPLRDDAKSTIAALIASGIDCWLCTGDHEVTALAVAGRIGIQRENVCAQVSPEGKSELVTRLKSRRMLQVERACEKKSGRVAFVGDGINDAIALVNADVGIAVGAGTEVAVDAADVVLVRSSLNDVVVAFDLSRTVFRRIILNFVWATSYNIFALPFAAGLLSPFLKFRLPPELAGLMMAFSSVTVVTSSLLLRFYKRPVISEQNRNIEPPTLFHKHSTQIQYKRLSHKQVDLELV